jgi:hypothetical protein
LWVEDVAWSVQQIHTAVNLGFLDWSSYFFIQVAPKLFSMRVTVMSQKLSKIRVNVGMENINILKFSVNVSVINFSFLSIEIHVKYVQTIPLPLQDYIS